ncbi:MAG: DUF4382 domain-containing protein [Gemmatimonadaceae bacterium]|nr:DUF4382 domain-containing protein [Gemmatimonadaceae bacterium]
MERTVRNALLAAALLAAAACAGDGVTGARMKAGQGVLAVKLTDAPIPLDSLKEVNVYVVRIDARRAHTDSAEVDDSLDVEHREGEDEHDDERCDSTAWVTIATPERAFNLLALQNGVTAFLGASPVDTGHFKAVRLVIDPAQSNIVLKDGTVLSASSTPPVEFERRGRHGLFVELKDALHVQEGSTTTLTLDLKLDQSLTLRGRGIRDGFFFRPVVDGRSHRDHD